MAGATRLNSLPCAGPPISPNEDATTTTTTTTTAAPKLDNTSPHALKQLDSKEEFGFEIPVSGRRRSLENGGVGDDDDDSEVEELEESGASEGEAEDSEKPEANPPPIPPRNHSLSPSPKKAAFLTSRSDVGSDLLRQEDSTKTSTSFLLEGRGGEQTAPPPQPRLLNGIATNGEVVEETSPSPPPLPAKSTRRRSHPEGEGEGEIKLQGAVEEERMLMNELDLLEKMVDSKDSSRVKQEALQGETREAEQRTEPTNLEQDSKA